MHSMKPEIECCQQVDHLLQSVLEREPEPARFEQSAASEDWIAVDRLTAQIDHAFNDVGVFIAGARESVAAV